MQSLKSNKILAGAPYQLHNTRSPAQFIKKTCLFSVHFASKLTTHIEFKTLEDRIEFGKYSL